MRIFTPAIEVPFAGHPTLGIGSIPVRFEREMDGRELLWMSPRKPEFGAVADVAELAPVLGLATHHFLEAPAPRQVSSGLPFWIVPLVSVEAVARCRLDIPIYERFVQSSEAKGILVFAEQGQDADNRIHARMFAPGYGVLEDPATGSANACLAGFLADHRLLGSAEVDVRVEQGCEMGRPSVLHLRAKQRDDGIAVQVGGRVIPVVRGDLL